MRYASADHLKRAHDLETQDQVAGAAAEYQLAADLDPTNTQALSKATALQKQIRDQVEASRPKPSIDVLREQAALQSTIPHLDPRVIVPSVNYPPPGAAVRDILKAIGDLTNINITYDQNLAQINNQYSFTVANESLETVLNQVLSNNGLTFKVLNSKTIFVYQDTPAKRQQFEDTYYQPFPLSHIEANDMVQILTTMITQGTNVRPVITQNKSTNTIIVKATEPVLKAIQQIIASNDKPRAEVVVDVEVLEVDRTRAKQLGLDLSNWALGFTLSPELAPPNTSGTFPGQVPPPINLNTVSHGVGINDVYMTVPTAQIKLLESDAKSKLLAKSQLRGREGDPLQLNLGEDVPVPVGVDWRGCGGRDSDCADRAVPVPPRRRERQLHAASDVHRRDHPVAVQRREKRGRSVDQRRRRGLCRRSCRARRRQACDCATASRTCWPA